MGKAEKRVADQIGQGKEDDRPELAEIAVGHPAAGKAQQVAAGRKEGSHHAALPFIEVHDIDEEKGEDGSHAVVSGSLGEFTPEDEPEADRMSLEETKKL